MSDRRSLGCLSCLTCRLKRAARAHTYTQAADRFGIERLKRMCEHSMLASISIENAASILLAADLHNVRAHHPSSHTKRRHVQTHHTTRTPPSSPANRPSGSGPRSSPLSSRISMLSRRPAHSKRWPGQMWTWWWRCSRSGDGWGIEDGGLGWMSAVHTWASERGRGRCDGCQRKQTVHSWADQGPAWVLWCRRKEVGRGGEKAKNEPRCETME